jgi:membrane protein implicated in regulation of membrane protease activity
MKWMKNIPPRVALRYLLVNLPGTLALALVLGVTHQWLGIPKWLFILVVCLWVVKEVVIFPFVWKSYDTSRPGVSGAIEGARGVVVEPLTPKGRVRVGGENWKAERVSGTGILDKGAHVRVLRRVGLTLFVEPL